MNAEQKRAEIIVGFTSTAAQPRSRYLAVCHGVPRSVMEQILAVPAMFSWSTDEHEYRTQKGMKRFYEPWDDGAFCLAPGLLPRAKKELESLGWTVDIRFTGQRYDEPGQVIVANEDDALDALQGFRSGWKDESVLVVAKKPKAVQNLVKRASGYVAGPITSDFNDVLHTRSRIVVVTPYLFSSANATDWDVVILWDSDFLLQKLTQKGCQKLSGSMQRDHHRPIACYVIHYGGHMVKLDQLTMEQFCGGVLYDGRVKPDAPQVDVVMVRHGGPVPEITENLSILDRKRTQMWQNRSRNELIAQIAEEIADGNPQRLQEFGLVREELDPESIAIVVESPEHAEQSAELLPEWTVRTYAAGPNGCTPNDPTTNQYIVTERYLVENPLKVDILIRATGGPHALALPAGAGLTAPSAFTLIDFVTVDDNQSVRDGQRRAENYEQANWPIRWITLAAEGNG